MWKKKAIKIMYIFVVNRYTIFVTKCTNRCHWQSTGKRKCLKSEVKKMAYNKNTDAYDSTNAGSDRSTNKASNKTLNRTSNKTSNKTTNKTGNKTSNRMTDRATDESDSMENCHR